MIGSELKTMFEGLVGDTMDETQFYIFLNVVKDRIESVRDWNFNRAFDNSNTVSAGDTYLTAKTLPATFLSPKSVYFHGDRSPLILISFEEREFYKDAYKRYYIDWLNSTFSICGATGAAGKTIDIFFARQTPDITATTSPVWPSSFHPILGFFAAEIFQASPDQDLDGLSLRAARENLRFGTDFQKSMIAWDAKIKTMEYNARNSQGIDISTYPDVVDLTNL